MFPLDVFNVLNVDKFLELERDEHPPSTDPRSQTRGGILMGLYITAHDDTVMGGRAAVHQSKAILK